ncbi:hypothetical protein [Paenibacillus sp.]|uniref:hypothetical protein n=1 Tax=Paenibacillus sp. TaxID=58172 RepID=UPI0028AD88A4|nr:hypothetical protein [Paenibacillus sp.]
MNSGNNNLSLPWANGWFSEPQKPAWVQELRGWQRIIMKHQFGKIYFRYDDLPRVYEEGKAVGVEMILLFGWWKGGFDNGYPVYEPDLVHSGAGSGLACLRSGKFGKSATLELRQSTAS